MTFHDIGGVGGQNLVFYDDVINERPLSHIMYYPLLYLTPRLGYVCTLFMYQVFMYQVLDCTRFFYQVFYLF